MEKLFNQFKNMLVVYPKYKGYVCGYNDAHFIIAVETKDDKNFFRKMENPYIMEEYKDVKYRYTFADESQLIKQSNNDKYKKAIDKD
jgi:hypothetical protein